jgi:hypothetical protein
VVTSGSGNRLADLAVSEQVRRYGERGRQFVERAADLAQRDGRLLPERGIAQIA